MSSGNHNAADFNDSQQHRNGEAGLLLWMGTQLDDRVIYAPNETGLFARVGHSNVNWREWDQIKLIMFRSKEICPHVTRRLVRPNR